MAATITKLCLIAVVVSQALCWVPRFINGRSRGGMLGAPRVAKGTPTPPALWFKQQRLDHFDGSNNRHWSQVCIFIIIHYKLFKQEWFPVIILLFCLSQILGNVRFQTHSATSLTTHSTSLAALYSSWLVAKVRPTRSGWWKGRGRCTPGSMAPSLLCLNTVTMATVTQFREFVDTVNRLDYKVVGNFQDYVCVFGVYYQRFNCFKIMLSIVSSWCHVPRDLSLENLRYLSSRQALADLAEFIDYFRSTRNLTANKLITFGGSYPGECALIFTCIYMCVCASFLIYFK